MIPHNNIQTALPEILNNIFDNILKLKKDCFAKEMMIYAISINI